MNTNWADFKNDVKAVLADAPPVNPVQMPPVVVTVETWLGRQEVKRALWLIGLLVLAVSLGIIILFGDRTWRTTQPVVQVTEAQKARMDIEAISQRLRVLGCLSNNNWTDYIQRFPNDSGNIVIMDKNWVMNQVPPYITKPDVESQKFLESWSN